MTTMSENTASAKAKHNTEERMNKILIVEDDKEINRLLCSYISSQGFSVISAFNGLEALREIREQADIALVLLDLMLPFQSGDMVLGKIREISAVPVIIVSAKDTVQTKIDILRMGADDYITKPFDLDEVLVRIETVLRRCNTSLKNETAKAELLTHKALVLDRTAKSATVNGSKIVLTAKEYAILELMLLNPTRLFSKAAIFESIWNEPYFSDDNTLKVHMSNLRSKLKEFSPDEEYIETVWGMGYKLSN